jgi:hypothetical protein
MPTTIKQQLIMEVEDLPEEIQEKILKLVHFLKEEILTEKKTGKPSDTEDMLSLIPKMKLGKMLTSMRREEVYDNAR